MNAQRLFLGTILSMSVSVASAQDKLVSGFEGDLSSVYGVDWTFFDAPNGIIDLQFVNDDPLDADSEGVTEGTQGLEVSHDNWYMGSQPWLNLETGLQVAQDILTYDTFSIDMTPIVALDGPGIGYRQAFLATSSSTFNFGFFQIDYDGEAAGASEETAQRNPFTLEWDLNQVIEERDGPPTGVTKTWKEIAQEAIDAEEGFMSLHLIFQGANNDFFEFPVQIVIDNARFSGASPSGVVGDYNNDGVVDAADYTVYRDNDGGLADAFPNRDPLFAALPVSQDDYVAWTLAYGNTASTSTAVPEPTSAVLLGVCLAAGLGATRRRR